MGPPGPAGPLEGRFHAQHLAFVSAGWPGGSAPINPRQAFITALRTLGPGCPCANTGWPGTAPRQHPARATCLLPSGRQWDNGPHGSWPHRPPSPELCPGHPALPLPGPHLCHALGHFPCERRDLLLAGGGAGSQLFLPLGAGEAQIPPAREERGSGAGRPHPLGVVQWALTAGRPSSPPPCLQPSAHPPPSLLPWGGPSQSLGGQFPFPASHSLLQTQPESSQMLLADSSWVLPGGAATSPVAPEAKHRTS